ncbi:MAG: hypothetical protein JST32_11935 [Bacteroidetes bacterium]|nr:hypothetical protein [Bacteroidota bacterium]
MQKIVLKPLIIAIWTTLCPFENIVKISIGMKHFYSVFQTKAMQFMQRTLRYADNAYFPLYHLAYYFSKG